MEYSLYGYIEFLPVESGFVTPVFAHEEQLYFSIVDFNKIVEFVRIPDDYSDVIFRLNELDFPSVYLGFDGVYTYKLFSEVLFGSGESLAIQLKGRFSSKKMEMDVKAFLEKYLPSSLVEIGQVVTSTQYSSANKVTVGLNALGKLQVEVLADLNESRVPILHSQKSLPYELKKASLSRADLDLLKKRKDDIIKLLKEAKLTQDKLTIPKVPPQEDGYDLSPSQKRIWILSQLNERFTAYNLPAAFLIEGDLDCQIFERALQEVVKRHETLRTIFKKTNQGEVRQFVIAAEEIRCQLEFIDFSQSKTADKDIDQLIQREFNTFFELSTYPLFRTSIYKKSLDQYVFALVIHGIISDIWSIQVIVQDLTASYKLYLTGQDVTLSSLSIQYKDVVKWQQERLKDADFLVHKNYWEAQFSEPVPVLQLATDKPRPPVKTYNGDVFYKKVDSRLLENLSKLSREHGATLFMGLAALVKILLYRYSGQEDIVIGTLISGRDLEVLEDQVGNYESALALRTRFSKREGYIALLGNIKKQILDAFDHRNYPLEELANARSWQGDASRESLFDVLVTLSNSSRLGAHDTSIGQLKISQYSLQFPSFSKFDLAFNFIDSDEGALVGVEYNTDIYYKSTIDNFLRHIQQLLAQVVDEPFTPLCRLEYIPEEERLQLLNNSMGPKVQYSEEITVISLFEYQARTRPSSTAIIFEGVELTYAELNSQVNSLAIHLNRTFNVGANDNIGILLDRSINMIVAILAILKAGSAYVPIDPEYPWEKIDYILADADVKVLITQSHYLDVAFYSGPKVDINNVFEQLEVLGSLPLTPKPQDLAYIIYTSGTSGRPKGVMVDHRNLMHALIPRSLTYKPISTFLLLTSISFDSSIAGIFGTLCYGGRLCITRKSDIADVAAIVNCIVENQVSHFLTVPSYYKTLIDGLENRLNSLQQVIVAGEPCPKKLVEKHFASSGLQNCDLYNEYGVTECTVWSSVHRYERNKPIKDSIGRPIANTQIYILDDDQNLMPIGMAGEICVGGGGVAQGYYNRPELASEKFIKSPFDEGGDHIYRTGDVGKWSQDGTIVFLGRKDNQVKMRGYRIELEEIEEVLLEHPNVELAAVTVLHDSEEKRLIAYITLRQEISVDEIRAFLNLSLPMYMIPAKIIVLPTLPMFANGKINKRALPDPMDAAYEDRPEYLAPRNQIEERLLLAWQQVLKTEKNIGVRSNFFSLGGHSIPMLLLVGIIKAEFQGAEISIRDFFVNPTIEEQAVLIRGLKLADHTA